MAKKKTATFTFSKYPTKLKFKKLFLPKSTVHGNKILELFSYSKAAFASQLKFKWQKLSASAFRLTNFTNLKQPYRKIIFRSSSYCFVNENTIKGVRRLLAPYFRGKKLKKISSIFSTVTSNYTFTKKPSAVRIGGGVGKKPRISGFFVKPGQSILTIYTRQPLSIRKRLISLSKKFPIKFSAVIA